MHSDYTEQGGKKRIKKYNWILIPWSRHYFSGFFFFSHSNQQTVVDILDKAVLDHECLPVLYLWLNWVIYSKLAIVQK